MSQEWMIDVLIDLRKFAQKNDLARLAEQLDDTIHVAAEEISVNAQGGSTSEGHGSHYRRIDRANYL